MRARDGDALLLAAGELGGRVVAPSAVEPHRVERLARRGARRSVAGIAAIEQRQLDVLERAWCARAG